MFCFRTYVLANAAHVSVNVVCRNSHIRVVKIVVGVYPFTLQYPIDHSKYSKTVRIKLKYLHIQYIGLDDMTIY